MFFLVYLRLNQLKPPDEEALNLDDYEVNK